MNKNFIGSSMLLIRYIQTSFQQLMDRFFMSFINQSSNTETEPVDGLYLAICRFGESRKHVIVNYRVNARYRTAYVKENQSKRHQGK